MRNFKKSPKISDELTIGVLKRFENLGKDSANLRTLLKFLWIYDNLSKVTAGVDLSDETHDSRRNFDKCQKMKRYSKCRNEYKLICFYARLFLCTSSVCTLESRFTSRCLFVNLYLGFFYVKAI